MRMGGVTADVLLKGQFLEVTGSVALFEIKTHETLPGKSKPVDPACEFSFSLDQDAPSGTIEKMGYSGRASILENRPDRGRHAAEAAAAPFPAVCHPPPAAGPSAWTGMRRTPACSACW